MTTVSLERTFVETEKKGELFASLARVIIAMVILFAAWVSRGAGPAGYPLFIIAVLYAVMSLIGVLLAYSKVFHQAIPYAFVAVDMTVVAFALTMLAQMHKLSVSHEFSLPLFSLSFVILIHASLRYRPSLIIFSFLTFLILLFTLPTIMNVPFVSNELLHKTHGHTVEKASALLLHDIGFLPILFLAASTLLLFMIVKRTRTITELALKDAQKVSQLSRFFSPKVAETFGTTDSELVQSGKRLNVAIIFIDIRGFSKLAENLSPEEVAEFLSAFRKKICEIIFKHEGTVDKFIGDAVLAVFGAIVNHDDSAQRALEASIEIRDAIKEWHICRERVGLPCAKVGIGGHYGEVFFGIIESGQILEHSVIGDTVNIAERLERKTRELNADFVFSDDLIKATKNQTSSTRFQSLEKVEIRGHKGLIKIWYE